MLMENLLPAPSTTAMPWWGRRGQSVTSVAPSTSSALITTIMMVIIIAVRLTNLDDNKRSFKGINLMMTMPILTVSFSSHLYVSDICTVGEKSECLVCDNRD